MHIQVRLAEPFWRVVGQRDLELELDENSLMSDLLALLICKFPELKREMAQAQPHTFIGEQEINPDTALHDGAQVHIVWPIAGG